MIKCGLVIAMVQIYNDDNNGANTCKAYVPSINFKNFESVKSSNSQRHLEGRKSIFAHFTDVVLGLVCGPAGIRTQAFKLQAICSFEELVNVCCQNRNIPFLYDIANLYECYNQVIHEYINYSLWSYISFSECRSISE